MIPVKGWRILVSKGTLKLYFYTEDFMKIDPTEIFVKVQGIRDYGNMDKKYIQIFSYK